MQDRHHMVSVRRPAVRPQVWLLDLLWLAGHGDDDGDDGSIDGDLVDDISPSSRSIGFPEQLRGGVKKYLADFFR